MALYVSTRELYEKVVLKEMFIPHVKIKEVSSAAKVCTKTIIRTGLLATIVIIEFTAVITRSISFSKYAYVPPLYI